ncbi:MAG: hypothetical protein ABF384_09625, partial [Verrucomicrobiales bacterium]
MKFENLQFKEADGGKNILVTGSLKSSDPAHSVIAYDSERGQFGDYWARTYVAPIDEKTSAFAVTVAVTSPHLTKVDRYFSPSISNRKSIHRTGRSHSKGAVRFRLGML